MTASEGTLICVVGARGGAGTTCFAAALAAAAQRTAGRGVLIDLDCGGPGVEVLLGIEREPGARWHDLAAARGDVDGRGLLSAVPLWDRVPVVSASRHVADPPSDDVVLDVCAGLLRAGQPVIADLPRPSGWTAAVRALLADADFVVLVAPLTMPGSAGAQALAAALRRINPRPGRGPTVLLVGCHQPSGHVLAADVAHLTGLDLAATVRHDRRLAADLEQGLGPSVGRRTRLGRAATQLVAQMGISR